MTHPTEGTAVPAVAIECTVPDTISAVVTGIAGLPLELIALIADHGGTDLRYVLYLMLSCRRLRDGVRLSRRWQVVKEVVRQVKSDDERREALSTHRGTLLHASRYGNLRLFQLLSISRAEACCCLPVLASGGHLSCVQFLATTLSLDRDTLPSQVVWGSLPEAFLTYLQAREEEDAEAGEGLDQEAKLEREQLGMFSVAGGFAAALVNGHAPVYKFLHEKYELSGNEVDRLYLFRRVCWRGRLADVKYLHATIGISAVHLHAGNLLCVVCQRGHLPVLKYLVGLGIMAADIRGRNNKALQLACKFGHVDVLRYIHTEFGLTSEDARARNNLALACACEEGHRDIVAYLHSERLVTEDDVRANSCRAFRLACKNGHLPVLRYLHSGFGMTVDDARAKDCSALCCACRRGHLSVVRFLRTTMDLTPADARKRDNRALRIACHKGHLSVVQYLRSAFGLTASDLRSANHVGLIAVVCSQGDIPLLQELHSMGLTKDDAQAHENHALRLACKGGHIGVLECLRNDFNLTAVDARAKNNRPLRLACKEGNLPVVQYLRTSFGLTADDARADKNAALRVACQEGREEVVHYLHTSFGLTAGDAQADDNSALRLAHFGGHLSVVSYLHTAFGVCLDSDTFGGVGNALPALPSQPRKKRSLRKLFVRKKG